MESYIGMKVLIQTDKQEPDLIPAIVDGFEMTGLKKDIKLIRYKKQSDGEVLYFLGGTVYPDTEDFREFFTFLKNRFPVVRDRWNFLYEMKNFYPQMQHLI